ncbi:hypothetical protein EGM70_04825 [Enterobacteriaceae bacterium 89]|nr:hypothetical protein [Enterobacteriaceae bacterium 89]
MKRSWFQHSNLTTEQAEQLIARYSENHVMTEKSLDFDLIHWTVSAYLPESKRSPIPDRRYQQRFWG